MYHYHFEYDSVYVVSALRIRHQHRQHQEFSTTVQRAAGNEYAFTTSILSFNSNNMMRFTYVFAVSTEPLCTWLAYCTFKDAAAGWHIYLKPGSTESTNPHHAVDHGPGDDDHIHRECNAFAQGNAPHHINAPLGR